jgi:diketogulonate reductase-like aldo/keto reductase
MKQINGFRLHPIGIGTWGMGGYRDPQTREILPDTSKDEVHIAAIRYSIRKGQNFIDTAEMYGACHTEEIVGRAIQGTDRNDLFLASKLWTSHAQREQALPAVQRMLERLQTSYLDLLYFHTPETPVPMAEYMAGMNDCAEAGLTRSLGVSNFSLAQLKEAMRLSKHPIVAIQNHYSVTFRDDPKLLDFCRLNNIAYVAYRPVERGQVAEYEIVCEIAKKHDATPAQVALAWLVQQENVIPIPKSSSLAHIDENLGSTILRLTDEEIVRLGAAHYEN